MHHTRRRGSYWRSLAGISWLTLLSLSAVPLSPPVRAEDYVRIPGKLDDYANPNFKEAVRQLAPNYDRERRDQQIQAYQSAYRQLNQDQTPLLSPYDSFLATNRDYGPNLPLPPLPSISPDGFPPFNYHFNPPFPRNGNPADYTFIPGYGYHYAPAPTGPFAAASESGDGGNQVVPPASDRGFNNVPFSTNPFVARPRQVDQLHVTQEHVNQLNVTELHAGPY